MMTFIASIVGALVGGFVGGFFAEEGTVQGELTQICWGFVGVIVGIVLFSQFGLI